MNKKNILILCTGNSCRSQIAQGFFENNVKEKANIYSAGVEVHGVNPLAIKTMNAVGINISNYTSNHIDEYKKIEFDYVITVCDHALEVCPYFPSGAIKLHHNFPDPAKATGTELEIAEAFETVRNQIEAFVNEFVKQNLNTFI